MSSVRRTAADRGVKRLSCKRCQYRKLKCSRTEPCTSCAAANTECEYRRIDQKRTPASSEYAASLESRVAWLESFIANLHNASDAERERMLQSAAINQQAGRQVPSDALRLDNPSSGNLELDLDGTLIFHGATSIYRTEPSGQSPSPSLSGHHLPFPGSSSGSESNFEHVMAHFGISIEGDVVINALTYFFRWQYPHFMFVYREAFLRDHFGDRKNCKYWSAALLMSLCALGTLMSDTEGENRRLSDQFFLAAESILMVSGLTKPSVPTVQAFLCLAFYEIGRGNLSKGWGFSGIAFRMAQDLGFQRDPKNWVSHDASLATNEDAEIRRRIYWGCYISDKMISLILGRPLHLAADAAEVDTLESLPNPPEMEYWRPVGFDDGKADGFSNIPYVLLQIRLAKIIESMLTTLFSLRADQDGLARRSNLDRINLELCRWRESLPDFAKWSKWDPSGSPPVPGVVSLHLFFHSARIALNYDHAVAAGPEIVRETSRQYCTTSAQDILALVRAYRVHFGLQHSPLVLVYASVQAIRAINALGISEEQSYLVQALGECSGAWDLARQMQSRLSPKSVHR